MDQFSGAPSIPTETASAFYAANSRMLGDPLHVQWDSSIVIVARFAGGVESPDDSITAQGGPQVMRAFKDNFQYFPAVQDTEALELRAGYVIAQAGETRYGPLGPGPINAASLHAEYKAAFGAIGNFQAKQAWLQKWFAPASAPQTTMTDAQAVAALNKAGYTA